MTTPVEAEEGPHGPARSYFFARLKEAAAHTAIYGLGSVLQTVLGFVLIPLYTRFYSPETYGILNLLVLIGTLAGAVFYFGASSAMARSYYDYDDEESRRAVVGTALAISLAGVALQVGLGIALARTLSISLFESPAYALPIVVAVLSSAATFVNNLFFMLLRLHRRSLLMITLNVLSLLLMTVLIVVLLVRLRLGVMAPVLGTFLAQAALLIALVILLRGDVTPRWSAHELRVQLHYGMPNVLVGLLYYALDSIDRFFINAYGSLSDVGVYSLGYRLGMMIQILLILPFSQIWNPMRMQYWRDERVRDLFRLMLTYYSMAGLLMTVTISVFAREVVQLVAGREQYLAAYRVVPFVMLGHFFYGMINILDNGIIFQRKVVYHAILFAVALVVNVALNVLLVPRIGYMGAAYATLVCYVLLASTVAIVSNRLFSVRWEGRRLGQLFLSALLVLVLGVYAGTHLKVPASVATKVLMIGGLGVGWYLFVLERWERRGLGWAWQRAGAVIGLRPRS